MCPACQPEALGGETAVDTQFKEAIQVGYALEFATIYVKITHLLITQSKSNTKT